jgi:hypothetical protein
MQAAHQQKGEGGGAEGFAQHAAVDRLVGNRITAAVAKQWRQHTADRSDRLPAATE